MTLLGLLALGALAQEADPEFTADLHGDVKTFGVAMFPYDHLLMGTTWEPPCVDSPLIPDEVCVPDFAADTSDYNKVKAAPMGQGTWNLRLKFEAEYKDTLKLQVHHAANASLGSMGGLQVQGFGTGVGQTAPEVVDLSWDAELDGDSVTLVGITDRASLTYSRPGLDITLGRQPVSFGQGMFFTPMDLVNPFTPTTIDSEYKPGVDALRVDGYIGMTGRLTVVGAYAGDWTAEEMVFAAYGQGTVGVTDLGAFAGLVHQDMVLGLSTVTSVGAVGLHGDATLTLPPEDEDPFVRAVGGATYRPTATTSLSGEAYVQSFGTTDPQEYLIVGLGDRFTRGEVWNFGVAYGGLSVAQEITPLVFGSLGMIANLTHPSAMVLPSLSWSVGQNAELGVGGFVGVGARPDKVRPWNLVNPADPLSPLPERQLVRKLGLNSEFGMYPAAVFTNLKAYF